MDEVIEKMYRLVEKEDETPEVLTVRFDPEDGEPLKFDPGMFIMISGIDESNKKYVARSFSVASEPSSKRMELYVVKQPHQGTAIAHTSHFVEAKIGDRFAIKGPYGQFRFDPNKDPKVTYIAGGTGIAPFMSMLRHIKALGADTDVKLLYSVKYPSEIIRKKELEEISKEIKLEYFVTVTRPQQGDGWSGLTGHIDANMIKAKVPDVNERMCYICGPPGFVNAIKAQLASLGVPQSRISADVWDAGN
ncbi:MAG: FAD-binding oxidoreductase [Candidatus Micrarchaeaceae archaeon]